MHFHNRADAAEQLAERLEQYREAKNIVILGIPRGGIPLAQLIGAALNIPFDLLIVQKIRAPLNEEFAIGAVAEGDICEYDEATLHKLAIDEEMRETLRNIAYTELQRKERLYRTHPIPELQDKTVLLVDDGIATGMTMRAAILAAKKFRAEKIIIVAPIIAKETLDILAPLVFAVVYVHAPVFFHSVSQFYHEFPQISDEEVRALCA